MADPAAWTVKKHNEKRLAAEHKARDRSQCPGYGEKPDAPAIAHARRELRAILKPDATVYTCLRHVSQSGLMRHLTLHVVHKGRIRDITALAARAQGDRVFDKHGAWIIKANGCGMDMGFNEVYNLSSALYGGRRFKCRGQTCGHNDHHNPPYPDRDGAMMHRGGGYTLRQEWI